MSAWNHERAEMMWRAGSTAAEIAEATGAPSRSAVLGHIRRAGVERDVIAGRWTPKLTEEVKRRWLNGETAAEISAAVGGVVTRLAVISKMSRLGLQRTSAASPDGAQPRTPASKSWGKGWVAPVLGPRTDLVAKENAPVAEPMGLKTLLERGPHVCCWPIGAPDPARGQLFCAAAIEGRGSYCPAHRPQQPRPAQPLRSWSEKTVRARRGAERDDCDRDLIELLA